MTTRKSKILLAMAFAAGSLPLALTAQEQNAASDSTCHIFGQVFGSDPLAGEMLVKTPSGTIETLLFDRTTAFTSASFDASSKAAPMPLTAGTVNEGDWICARTGAGTNAKRATAVLVAPRQEIQRRQREVLARWFSDGAFGTVIELQPKSTSLVLECHRGGNTKRVLVNTDDKTRFHRWNGVESSEIALASWTQVRLGDRIYVHGSSPVDGKSLNATSVIIGGVQPFAGTLGAINALDETVRLNELITGETVTVHVNPEGPRLISPGPKGSQREDSARARVLQTIDFGDIREGDSVIVLARQDESSGTKIYGLALIVNFGEPTLQDVSGQVSWKLMPVTLGLP
jgi:hypothetical protein